MPDFADVDGRFLRGVFAEQDVEIDLRDLLVADGVHGEERGVHEHDFGVAGGLVLGGLLLDLLLERWGGELGDIGKIALVPRIVQTGIGGLRAAKELFFIESGRLLGFILIQGLLAGRRRGQRLPVRFGEPPYADASNRSRACCGASRNRPHWAVLRPVLRRGVC